MTDPKRRIKRKYRKIYTGFGVFAAVLGAIYMISGQVGMDIVAVGLACLFIFTFYSPDNKRQRRLLEYGSEVEGTIVDFWCSRARGLRWAYYCIQTEYIYNDAHYNAKTQMMPIPSVDLCTNIDMESDEATFPKGRKVALYVDPKNPSNFIVYELSNFEIVNV